MKAIEYGKIKSFKTTGEHRRFRQEDLDAYMGVEKEKQENRMKITRAWAMPNFATFTIKPIAELLKRYDIGKNWIDPFAGWNSPAEFTNDINPKAPTTHHAEAEKFVKSFGDGKYQALFDPPYSNRQISEHYKESGLQPNWRDTSAEFYSRVKDPLASKIKKGGYVISFGWNSAGMGKNRGFEIVEILLVAHGGAHNDTIVTVERKEKITQVAA